MPITNTNTDNYLFTGNLTAANVTATVAISAPVFRGDGSQLTGIASGGSNVSGLSGNWQSTYTTMTANSASWTSVYNTVCALSASWGSASGVTGTGTTNTIPKWVSNSTLGDSKIKDTGTIVTVLTTLSGVSDLYITGNILSAGINLLSIFSTGGDTAVNNLVHSNSGNWNSSYTTLTSSSANWQNTYTTVSANSANWSTAYQYSSAYNLSASNYNNVWSTVQTNSANWSTAYQSATAYNLSASNYNNMYSSYSTSSGTFATNSFVDSKFFPASGGTISGTTVVSGNLTVAGSISASGTATFFNTIFTTTSALCAVATSSGPALYIGQQGSGDLASFYDLSPTPVEVLHIGASVGIPGVGVYTSTPNKELTVVGEISATSNFTNSGKIFTTDGNSDQWNSSYSTVQSKSATTWNYQGTDLKDLSANWQSSYTALTASSANWSTAYQYATAYNLSASNYNNVFSTVYSNSATTWNYQGSDIKALTASWQNSTSTVSSTSARWENVWTTVNTNSATWVPSLTSNFTFVMDGGGAVIVPGQTTFMEVPYNATLTQWTLVADTSGSLIVAVSSATYGNFPTFGSIDGGATYRPTLANVAKNQLLNLQSTGWSTTVNAGTILAFTVLSANTISYATLSLKAVKS
ncbi:MAG: hypothetical protein EBU90_23460 [Proteobacteria bacterium]|nr:hypothetical protein [Pseudomonadota bacterium]